MKKTIVDEIYGKMTFSNDFWDVKRKQTINIGNKENNVKIEVDIIYVSYSKYIMGLMSTESQQFFSENMELLEKDKAEELDKNQKNYYQKFMIDNIEHTQKSIEEAALKELEENIKDETEESFAKQVGKEKAQRVFAAKTREEKLASLELKRMRVMKDRIEITCTCDWYQPSGGFVIFPDGGVEMMYVDSLSI